MISSFLNYLLFVIISHFFYTHLVFSFEFIFYSVSIFSSVFWLALLDFSLNFSLNISLDLSIVDQLAKMKENHSVPYSEWYSMHHLVDH